MPKGQHNKNKKWVLRCEFGEFLSANFSSAELSLADAPGNIPRRRVRPGNRDSDRLVRSTRRPRSDEAPLLRCAIELRTVYAALKHRADDALDERFLVRKK